MRRVTIKKPDPRQQNIQSLFQKKEGIHTSTTVGAVGAVGSGETVVAAKPKIPRLKSDDPIVQQYYDSLSEREQRSHTIAIDMLGTSYDAVRTHGFLNWQKARK